MKKHSRGVIYCALLLCLILMACAGAQQAYNKMTPEEQTRTRIDFFQSQLATLFDQGKAFVTANPQYNVTWKTKAVPAFDIANKAIRAAIINAKSPGDVDAAMDPLIDAIVQSLPIFTQKKCMGCHAPSPQPLSLRERVVGDQVRVAGGAA